MNPNRREVLKALVLAPVAGLVPVAASGADTARRWVRAKEVCASCWKLGEEGERYPTLATVAWEIDEPAFPVVNACLKEHELWLMLQCDMPYDFATYLAPPPITTAVATRLRMLGNGCHELRLPILRLLFPCVIVHEPAYTRHWYVSDGVYGGCPIGYQATTRERAIELAWHQQLWTNQPTQPERFNKGPVF